MDVNVVNPKVMLGKEVVRSSVELGELQYCAKEMQMKCVEIRPLFTRNYVEKSTNFRERSRWILPEKLATFVDFSQ